MENNEFVFNGFIKIEYDDKHNKIFLIDEGRKIDLVKKMRAIFDLYDAEVSVSYYVSDKKCTQSEMVKGWLSTLYGFGFADYDIEHYHYSEHTYDTEYNTYLKIGGHNLFRELENHKDKWCILKVTIKSN